MYEASHTAVSDCLAQRPYRPIPLLASRRCLFSLSCVSGFALWVPIGRGAAAAEVYDSASCQQCLRQPPPRRCTTQRHVSTVQGGRRREVYDSAPCQPCLRQPPPRRCTTQRHVSTVQGGRRREVYDSAPCQQRYVTQRHVSSFPGGRQHWRSGRHR